MKFNDLTEEQKAKALACKSPEELLALAKAEGYDLSDDELDAISGGNEKSDGMITPPAPNTFAKQV